MNEGVIPLPAWVPYTPRPTRGRYPDPTLPPPKPEPYVPEPEPEEEKPKPIDPILAEFNFVPPPKITSPLPRTFPSDRQFAKRFAKEQARKLAEAQAYGWITLDNPKPPKLSSIAQCPAPPRRWELPLMGVCQVDVEGMPVTCNVRHSFFCFRHSCLLNSLPSRIWKTDSRCTSTIPDTRITLREGLRSKRASQWVSWPVSSMDSSPGLPSGYSGRYIVGERGRSNCSCLGAFWQRVLGRGKRRKP